MDETKMRQCKLGELCWVTTVSRPDMCAQLARVASRIKSLCGGDVYRINVLARAVREGEEVMMLKYASPSHPWKGLRLEGKAQGDLRNRGETLRCGTLSFFGWSGAAYGGQSTAGKCRSGYVIGTM